MCVSSLLLEAGNLRWSNEITHTPTNPARCSSRGRKTRIKKSICQDDFLPCTGGPVSQGFRNERNSQHPGEEQAPCRPGRKRAYLAAPVPGPACLPQAWAGRREILPKRVCVPGVCALNRDRKRGEASSLVYAVIILSLSTSNFYNQQELIQNFEQIIENNCYRKTKTPKHKTQHTKPTSRRRV